MARHHHACCLLHGAMCADSDCAGSVIACCAGPQATQTPWQESTEAIDKGLLMARDPILFYDEVPLYESELDDNGVASLTVKVGTGPAGRMVHTRIAGCRGSG